MASIGGPSPALAASSVSTLPIARQASRVGQAGAHALASRRASLGVDRTTLARPSPSPNRRFARPAGCAAALPAGDRGGWTLPSFTSVLLRVESVAIRWSRRRQEVEEASCNDLCLSESARPRAGDHGRRCSATNSCARTPDRGGAHAGSFVPAERASLSGRSAVQRVGASDNLDRGPLDLMVEMSRLRRF